jgi:hypothetical protein
VDRHGWFDLLLIDLLRMLTLTNNILRSLLPCPSDTVSTSLSLRTTCIHLRAASGSNQVVAGFRVYGLYARG